MKDIGWWSVYEIGQRLCDKFDDVPAEECTRLPRVFIAGDACHTHSAKAGQGMNVSMADAWNLGWKLAAVLSGHGRPELLHTYSRGAPGGRPGADRLRPRVLRDVQRPVQGRRADGDASIRRSSSATSSRQGRFTAGVATRYAPSMITAEPTFQHLATGFPVGMRFHSAPVIRLADAKPIQLGHAARADGAWRLYVFADRDRPAARARLCEFLGVDEVADAPLHARRAPISTR